MHKLLKNLSLFALHCCCLTLFAESENPFDSADCPKEFRGLDKLSPKEQDKIMLKKETFHWKGIEFNLQYPNLEMSHRLHDWQDWVIAPDEYTPHEEIEANCFSNNRNDLRRLGIECFKLGEMRTLFENMCRAPTKFCAQNLHRNTSFPPLHLSECACENTGAFNRFATPRRQNLEDHMIRNVSNIFPHRDQTLKILSIGCGDLLQEAIVLGRLIDLGYKNIELSVVSFYLQKKDVVHLKRFFEEFFPEITITWHYGQTVHDLNKNHQFDLVFAIDLDEWLEAYTKIGKRIRSSHSFRLELDDTFPKGLSLDQISTGLDDFLWGVSRLSDKGAAYLGAGCGDFIVDKAGLKFIHKISCHKDLEILLPTLDTSKSITLGAKQLIFPAMCIFDLLDRGHKEIRVFIEGGSLIENPEVHLFKRIYEKLSSSIHVEIVQSLKDVADQVDILMIDPTVATSVEEVNGNTTSYFIKREIVDQPEEYNRAKHLINFVPL